MKIFMKSSVSSLLMLGILFQVGILGAEYLNSVYPLWTGTKVYIETRPVDPRSMFRGQYARLSYDFDSIAAAEIDDDRHDVLRIGTPIYVVLKEEKGVWKQSRVSTTKPEDVLFIRGRVKSLYRRTGSRSTARVRVGYGIEAFFASPKRALELEKELRRRTIAGKSRPRAEIFLAKNGKALLNDIYTPH